MLILPLCIAAGSFGLLDRETIVRRHNPTLRSVNTSEVVVLGNGAFAVRSLLSFTLVFFIRLPRHYSGSDCTSSSCQDITLGV